MVHLHRLILACVLAVFSLQASAVITPVVQYRDSLNRVDTASGLVAWWQAYDPKFACGGPSLDKPATWEARNVTPQQFDLYKVGSYCNDQGTYNTLTQSPTAAGSACPANSSVSGSACTCNTGYTEVNGACEARNENRDGCASFAVSQTLPGGALVQDYRLQGNVSDGAQFCMPGAFDSASKGCKVSFSRDTFLDYGGAAAVTEGTFSMAGNSSTVDQSCDVGPNNSPPKVPEKEKCPNGYTGTVNGVEVCINKVPNSGADGGSNETETNDGTETTTRRVDRSTNCVGDNCTTTTTTTTTRRNNSTGASTSTVTTETSTTSKPGFCQQNPSSKLCKDGKDDGSSFGGSCGAGFTCEGDAIQCAMAQEQHRRACKMFDDKSAESDLYNANKGKEGNQTIGLPGNETINLQGRIDTSDALGGGSCFGDLNITVWNQAVTLPLSSLCQYLAMLGNILVAVSLLMAARIVTRG